MTQRLGPFLCAYQFTPYFIVNNFRNDHIVFGKEKRSQPIAALLGFTRHLWMCDKSKRAGIQEYDHFGNSFL